jgi:hypothetical protein
MISGRFLPESTKNWQESTGKNPQNFPAGILLPCSGEFQCFPAGYGDFSASFLQDPVAGIIDLGIYHSLEPETSKIARIALEQQEEPRHKTA